MSIHGKRFDEALDRHITREPDWEEDEYPMEICPSCGRDSLDHKVNDHFCEFTNERVVTMIPVHISFIEKVMKNEEIPRRV